MRGYQEFPIYISCKNSEFFVEIYRWIKTRWQKGTKKLKLLIKAIDQQNQVNMQKILNHLVHVRLNK